MKYLREREWGFVFEVSRGGLTTRRRFLFRRHGGRSGALKAAQRYRDSWHMRSFNQPITLGFTHVTKRKGALDPDLPPRVSIAKINNQDRYYVVSSTDTNGKQYKVRFSIIKLGNDCARSKAIEYAKKHSSSK